jgi:hypothetical protein
MSLQEFDISRNKFVEGEWKFTYLQGSLIQETPVTSIRMAKETPFLYRMTMQGVDSLGDWSSEGYYLLTASGIEFWMLKDYKDK